MNELLKLSHFIAQFRLAAPSPLLPQVRRAAIQCVQDTLGAALGAAGQPMFQRIRKTYLAWEGQGGKSASLWGSGTKAPLRTAVFLNAMMAHILELDDVHTQSKTHIGTVVIPAAWGMAEALGAGMEELLEAVVCGYETMARIGTGFGVSSHRNKGWHVTGTAGTFGAAAACGKLLGLDEKQLAAAFGLAGTQSSGTWAFLSDGATNKVLHPARAAACGLESCLLVLGGMRGSAHILDAADGGIFPMMSDAWDYSRLNRGLGQVYEILSMDKKPYPCCRSTHCAIDGALLLRDQYALKPEDINAVYVRTYLVGLKQCGLTESSRFPKLPTDAKFSTPYTVARALEQGSVGLSDFLPQAIASPKTSALAQKVTVLEDKAFTARYPDHWGCRVDIQTNSGASYFTEIPDASGSVWSPLSARQLKEKFYSCCAGYEQGWLDGLFTALENSGPGSPLPSLNPSQVKV